MIQARHDKQVDQGQLGKEAVGQLGTKSLNREAKVGKGINLIQTMTICLGGLGWVGGSRRWLAYNKGGFASPGHIPFFFYTVSRFMLSTSFVSSCLFPTSMHPTNYIGYYTSLVYTMPYL